MKTHKSLFYQAIAMMAFAILLSGCGSKSSKELASVSGTMTVMEMNDVYRMDNTGYYQLAETRNRMKTEVTVDGEKQPPEEETDTNLPKKDQGEYDRCKISKEADGRVYLLEESRYVEEGEPSELKIHGELEFLEGDWTAYEAGKDVKVRYTAEAHKEVVKTTESHFETMLVRPMEAGMKLAARMKAKQSSKINVSSKLKLKEAPNSEILVNKREIRISETRPTTMEIDVRATAGK